KSGQCRNSTRLLYPGNQEAFRKLFRWRKLALDLNENHSAPTLGTPFGVEFQLRNYQITQLPDSHLEQSCFDRNDNKILVTDGITNYIVIPGSLCLRLPIKCRMASLSAGPRPVNSNP